MKTSNWIKKLNLTISIIVLVLGIFIVIQPNLPDIVLAISKNKYEGYTYNSTRALEKLGEISKDLPDIPKDNRLVIPNIYVNASINEGEDLSALDHGMGHRPNTSTPDKGGNTVVIGHRRLFTSGAGTLYHLDKLNVNDIVLVYWQGKEYSYKVFEITVVSPEQVDIEDNTINPILTLYTCTPLWTSEKRLVVKSKLL